MMAKDIECFNRLRALAERHGFRLTKAHDGGCRLADPRGEGFGPTLHGGVKAIEDFLAKREPQTPASRKSLAGGMGHEAE